MLERVNENLFHMVSPFQPVGGGSPSKQPKFRSEAKIFPIYGGEVNMGDKETFCLCVLDLFVVLTVKGLFVKTTLI